MPAAAGSFQHLSLGILLTVDYLESPLVGTKEKVTELEVVTLEEETAG